MTAQELQAEMETLNRLGLTLASQLDMERLVEAVTDAGLAITGAAFGTFLYRDASGGWSHFVSGAPRDAFVDFPLSQDAEAFGSPFRGDVCRSDDLERDPRYGENLPFKRMPPGQLPARSYLAAEYALDPTRRSTASIPGLFPHCYNSHLVETEKFTIQQSDELLAVEEENFAAARRALE